MIKAVVFDMDGVLIEAKDWHYHALNRALELFGYTIQRHEHLTTFDGLPTKKKLEILSVQSGLPIELHAFINEMKQHYTMEIVYTQCKPRFNHEYALAGLKARGMRLAVASNSIRQTVQVMMDKSHLASYLDIQLSNEDVQRAKPYPDIYQRAMEQLGVAPHECLVVEDNENGIKAATDAGAHVLVVQSVDEVTLDNIERRIGEVEGAI